MHIYYQIVAVRRQKELIQWFIFLERKRDRKRESERFAFAFNFYSVFGVYVHAIF